MRKLHRERLHPSVTVESPHAPVIGSSNAAGHSHAGLAPVGHPSRDGSGNGAAPSVVLGTHENDQQEDYLWGV
jgi:hypothetical protein